MGLPAAPKSRPGHLLHVRHGRRTATEHRRSQDRPSIHRLRLGRQAGIEHWTLHGRPCALPGRLHVPAELIRVLAPCRRGDHREASLRWAADRASGDPRDAARACPVVDRATDLRGAAAGGHRDADRGGNHPAAPRVRRFARHCVRHFGHRCAHRFVRQDGYQDGYRIAEDDRQRDRPCDPLGGLQQSVVDRPHARCRGTRGGHRDVGGGFRHPAGAVPRGMIQGGAALVRRRAAVAARHEGHHHGHRALRANDSPTDRPVWLGPASPIRCRLKAAGHALQDRRHCQAGPVQSVVSPVSRLGRSRVRSVGRQRRRLPDGDDVGRHLRAGPAAYRRVAMWAGAERGRHDWDQRLRMRCGCWRQARCSPSPSAARVRSRRSGWVAPGHRGDFASH